ncbi:hypothetical protein ACG873_07170 [Mesorhizobium sp. AaZ16]|uniref:hypothetical protein n=1 Tax=Mesorhizobium sp. AaZ16 TaxID=3402289 RepID=UPI00374E881D
MTAFAIEPFDAQHEIFATDGTSKWTPCRVIGVTIKDGEPSYVVALPGSSLECLALADYIQIPEPWRPRRPSA